jgi:hypothetical protein
VRSDHLPEEKTRVFIEAFSALPQKILWKWESDILPGQPANVKIGKWLPQQDILGIMALYMIDYIHNYEHTSAMTISRVSICFMAKGNIWGDSQTTCGTTIIIITRGVPNRLNYCVIFTIYT